MLEEAGELHKAVLDLIEFEEEDVEGKWDAIRYNLTEAVRDEAAQTAAMALRFLANYQP